jgi:hypothetical protein
MGGTVSHGLLLLTILLQQEVEIGDEYGNIHPYFIHPYFSQW